MNLFVLQQGISSMGKPLISCAMTRCSMIAFQQALRLVLFAGGLLTTPAILAEDSSAEPTRPASVTSEFLSDPSRTGSLVGSILLGAAVANPLAPLVGSIAGFLIGKRSDYTRNPTQTVALNRSFIPDADVQVASIEGLTGEPLPELGSPTARIAVREELEQFTQATGSGNRLPLPVADLCHQVRPDQPLPPNCYYHQYNLAKGLTIDDTNWDARLTKIQSSIPVGSPIDQKVSSYQPTQLTTSFSIAGSHLQQQLGDACRQSTGSQPKSMKCYYYFGQ